MFKLFSKKPEFVFCVCRRKLNGHEDFGIIHCYKDSEQAKVEMKKLNLTNPEDDYYVETNRLF